MPVLLAARRTDRLAEVAGSIIKAGGRAEAVGCDVSDEAQCRRAVERCVEVFGSIYAVFANAGFGVEAPVLESDGAIFDDMMKVNYHGSMHVVRYALEPMRAARSGHVLFCSSCLSKIGLPFYSAYCISKAAQDYAARALRHELRAEGIRVSSVHPTSTRTEFFDLARTRSRDIKFDLSGRTAFMHPPEKVGRAVVRCLRRPRGEVWTSPLLRFILGVAVICPETTDRVLRRIARKRGHPV